MALEDLSTFSIFFLLAADENFQGNRGAWGLTRKLRDILEAYEGLTMFDPFRAACLWVFGSLLQPGYCSPTAYSVLVFLSLGYILLLSLKRISSNHHRPSASVFGPRSPRTNLPSGVVLYESSLLPRLRPVPVRSALIRTRPTPFRASCRVARRLRATMTWRPSAPWKSSISRPPSWAVRTC